MTSTQMPAERGGGSGMSLRQFAHFIWIVRFEFYEKLGSTLFYGGAKIQSEY